MKIASTTHKVKCVIIQSLELGISPEEFDEERPLFAPSALGGMDLDSLAAIEIVVGLCKEFGISLDEVPREAFRSASTLADFVDQQISA